MKQRAPDPADLEQALGYSFENPDLLALALTHVGAAKHRNRSYQRLEFLGDRVLGLCVASMLYAAFPEADEGELSRRLAALVRRESCVGVAQAWGAEAFIKLGAGERKALRQVILGDICESIIGAVYLDGGLDAARGLIERSFEPLMRAPPQSLRDPKTALQEWAQGRGLAAPLYRETSRTGPDHAPAFTVAVIIEGYAEVEGTGPSKRAAEQAAAEAFVARETPESVP